MAQRDVILQSFFSEFDLGKKRGLEIGPYDRPFLSRAACPRILYADVFSTSDLVARAHANKKRIPNEVVKVDYVLQGRELAEVVPRESMEFVFCSHVLEHVPDLISALTNIEAVLRPGGLFLCAYPDRHYTFDIDRSATSFAVLLDRHERKVMMPDPETVYDFFSKHRRVRVGAIWQGLSDALAPRSNSEEFARAKAEAAREKYIDVHCNIFCAQEFRDVIGEMRAKGLLSLDIVKFAPTCAPLNEFYIALRKP